MRFTFYPCHSFICVICHCSHSRILPHLCLYVLRAHFRFYLRALHFDGGCSAVCALRLPHFAVDFVTILVRLRTFATSDAFLICRTSSFVRVHVLLPHTHTFTAFCRILPVVVTAVYAFYILPACRAAALLLVPGWLSLPHPILRTRFARTVAAATCRTTRHTVIVLS